MFFSAKGKESFSQCGEDRIISFLLDQIKITNPSYLDIGAHHPTYISNTYYFYKNGSRGICIEPDPKLAAYIGKIRPHDTTLNIGVGDSDSVMDFYVIDPPTLNTFSKEEAERYSAGSHRILDVIPVPVKSINSVLTDICKTLPDFVSIDVEGLDLEILKSWDFKSFRPPVFCIETITYTEDTSEQKIAAIEKLMLENGYIVYADTYINTIFVEEKIWQSR